ESSGSRKNFASLCKAFARDLDRPVYALDLRNHGSSPHAQPMNYQSMAADVHHFITKNKLKDVSLLGHSMWVFPFRVQLKKLLTFWVTEFRGGKVAMTLALSASLPTLSNLIVSDIAPTRSALSPSFQRYLKVMSHIENPVTGIRTREAADKVLQSEEKVVLTKNNYPIH
ncbi:hypothetical protein H0H81_012049, partial [Sphagnurus paluster]